MRIITKARQIPESSIVKLGQQVGALTRGTDRQDSRVFIITSNGAGIEIDEDTKVELIKSSADMAEAWLTQYRLVKSLELE